jgi:Kdo2-lipid IVA lauroyltransferase/acyltransferase
MAVFYYIFRAFAWVISLMPFWLLYVISDILYYPIYYVIRYRRKVVDQNLRNSFPGLTPAQLGRIRRKFYHNLSDLLLEVLRMRRLTPEQFRSRIRIDGLEIMKELFDAKKSVIVSIGHCGNWEWLGAFANLALEHKYYGVYKPLSGKRFAKYLEESRSLFSTNRLIPFKLTFRQMAALKDEITATVIAGDQTPTREESKYWFQFLNQETAFFMGIEKIAKALKQAVVFFDVQREGRGRYRITVRLITDKAEQTREGEITRAYIHLLETAIRNNPDNWLWSHKRWKHKRTGV